MKKIIFNKQKKNPVSRSSIQSLNRRNKYILPSLKAPVKTIRFAQKQAQNQRSVHIGMYPVPTGRILETYAHKHHLDKVVPMNKQILNTDQIIGVDEPINRSKPKKQLTYHEAVRRYPGMCPCKDSDGDGVVNLADCRPFDRKKQDEEFNDYYGEYADLGIDEPKKDKMIGKQSMNLDSWRRVADEGGEPKLSKHMAGRGITVKTKQVEFIESPKRKK